jgi:uncharacterized membrane protein
VEPPGGGLDVEALVARVLHLGTLAAMALLLIGVVLMLASGVDPLLAETVPFDASTLVGDILALRAAGFLWLGIVLVIVLPIGRVALELAGATARRDRPMTLISGGILVVVLIAIGIALASPA